VSLVFVLWVLDCILAESHFSVWWCCFWLFCCLATGCPGWHEWCGFVLRVFGELLCLWDDLSGGCVVRVDVRVARPCVFFVWTV